MYCNTACSATELKEICLQCFNRHLKSRCSRRMRLLRKKQSSKCCECIFPYQGQQPFPGAGVGSGSPSTLAKHCKASHSSREGVHMETGQGTEQETTLFSWACLVHVLQCQVQRSELLLSFRHVHCPHPPSHSCLETLSVRFTLYLLMGQGWHQTLYSSQGSTLCMWLVRRGTALQFWFLMNQHSLKERLKNKIKSKSTKSLLGKGKAKAQNPPQPKDTQSHSSCLRKLPALLLPSQS